MHKWICGLALFLSVSLNAQVKVHHVQGGETLYGISKLYNVSSDALLEANPFLIDGLKTGQELVIPSSINSRPEVVNVPIDTNTFDYFVVEPQQTLYSLSHLWNLSVDQLLELNPTLHQGLKVGQQLKLPKGTLSAVGQEVRNEISKPGLKKHLVLPGETVYSLTHGVVSTEYFFELNPELEEEGLRAGGYVWLPDANASIVLQEKVLQDVEEEYVRTDNMVPSEVQSVHQSKLKVIRVTEDDSWTILERKYHTTKARLIELNPETMNGLRVGQYIIVPAAQAFTEAREVKDSRLSLLEGKSLHFALALPLYLEENDSLAAMYNAGLSTSKVFPASQFAFDFYSGLKLAVDSLRSYGLNIVMDVYDTRNDLATVRQIGSSISSSDALFVLGPIYSRNAEALCDQLPNTLVISPLSRTTENKGRFHCVQAVSSLGQEHAAIAHWINEEARNANVILVRHRGAQHKQVVESFLQHIEASEFRTISHLEMGENLLTANQIRARLAAGKRDVFVILDDDPVLMTSFVNGASALNDPSISVISTGKLLEMKTIDVSKLNALDVYIADAEYVNYHSNPAIEFILKYRETMKTEPSRFAFHGYDAGMYFLSTLALSGSLEDIDWPSYRGLIKTYEFAHHAGEGPRNEGVFILHLQDYIWFSEN